MRVESGELEEFHPLTLLRDWGNGDAFRIADALTGVAVFGATGSGKTSGPAKHLAYGYLAAGFGGIVLCAKKEERRQWELWAAETGRTEDLVIVDASGKWRFNFLDWEAARPEEGGGLTINIVSILDEIAGAIARAAGKAEGGGDNKFWDDALHHMNTNLVELPLLAGLRVSLPLMRSIVNSAPQNLDQVNDPSWQEQSVCFRTLVEADEATAQADAEVRADFEECRNYWVFEWPTLSEKTRSIVSLSFSMLVRPFITRPLRQLFCADTNIQPEAAFTGKILIIDLPVQEYRLAGRIASLTWKFCFQIAVLRRLPPEAGHLLPVFLWADEAQNFVSSFDAEYQATARSAGGCTVYLTQNRESYRRVLGNYDAVDSLLGNLNCKMFCQNSSTETNEWAAKLLGERWLQITGTNFGQSRGDGSNTGSNSGSHSSGVNRSEQRRYFVEASRFTTLKRGGAKNNYQVETIVYNGGHLFDDGCEQQPFRMLTFNQR
jgi:hypothetical protein